MLKARNKGNAKQPGQIKQQLFAVSCGQHSHPVLKLANGHLSAHPWSYRTCLQPFECRRSYHVPVVVIAEMLLRSSILSTIKPAPFFHCAIVRLAALYTFLTAEIARPALTDLRSVNAVDVVHAYMRTCSGYRHRVDHHGDSCIFKGELNQEMKLCELLVLGQCIHLPQILFASASSGQSYNDGWPVPPNFCDVIDIAMTGDPISGRSAGPGELFSSDFRACARSPRWAMRCSFGLLKSVAA